MTAAVETAPMVTTPQVVKQTGVTFRQLHYWVGWGVLQPVTAPGKPSSGSGARWLWDGDEIRVATVVAQLLAFAAVKGNVSPLATFMGGNWPGIRQAVRDHTAGWLLVASDGRVGVTDQPEQLYRWQRTARVSITVDLAGVL